MKDTSSRTWSQLSLLALLVSGCSTPRPENEPPAPKPHRNGSISGINFGALGPGLGKTLEGVRFGDPQPIPENDLPRKEFERIVRGNDDAIKACYEKNARDEDAAKDVLYAQFDISPEGKVDFSKIDLGATPARNEAVQECIRKEAVSWQFPKSSGGATILVRYSFALPSVQVDSTKENDRGSPDPRNKPMRIRVENKANGGYPAGSMTREEIEGTIRSNLVSIKKCYEISLQENRNLQGKVTVRFVIDDEGKVDSSEIDPERTSIDSEAVKSCIRKEILSWKFPEPITRGKVNVGYPFVLQPRLPQRQGEATGGTRE